MSDASIVLENVTKQFAGAESPAVDRLSFTIPPGEIVDEHALVTVADLANVTDGVTFGGPPSNRSGRRSTRTATARSSPAAAPRAAC